MNSLDIPGLGSRLAELVAQPEDVHVDGAIRASVWLPPNLSHHRPLAHDLSLPFGKEPEKVEFLRAEVEELPVEDASVDVVISNCVLNLSPDKPQVWRDIARVLKPGGRVAVSDIALLQPLPPAVAAMLEACLEVELVQMTELAVDL